MPAWPSADLGDQALEAFPVGVRAGLAQVAVDGDALRPASRVRPRAGAARTGAWCSRCSRTPGAASTGARTGRRCGPGARRSPSPRSARSPPLTPVLRRPTPSRASNPTSSPSTPPALGYPARLGVGGETVDTVACRTRGSPRRARAADSILQPQPPAVDIAAQRPGPQPAHTRPQRRSHPPARIVDVIVRLHFWNLQRAPGPAPPTAGAP